MDKIIIAWSYVAEELSPVRPVEFVGVARLWFDVNTHNFEPSVGISASSSTSATE